MTVDVETAVVGDGAKEMGPVGDKLRGDVAQERRGLGASSRTFDSEIGKY